MKDGVESVWDNAIHFWKEGVCISKHLMISFDSLIRTVPKEVRNPPIQ